MAENNAAHNRSLHLQRDVQFAAASIYQHLYGKVNDDTGQVTIPATFQIINMLGWKPHASQPKPLQRGAGEVSLKDLYRIEDVVKEIRTIKENNKK